MTQGLLARQGMIITRGGCAQTVTRRFKRQRGGGPSRTVLVVVMMDREGGWGRGEGVMHERSR